MENSAFRLSSRLWYGTVTSRPSGWRSRSTAYVVNKKTSPVRQRLDDFCGLQWRKLWYIICLCNGHGDLFDDWPVLCGHVIWHHPTVFCETFNVTKNSILGHPAGLFKRLTFCNASRKSRNRNRIPAFGLRVEHHGVPEYLFLYFSGHNSYGFARFKNTPAILPVSKIPHA